MPLFCPKCGDLLLNGASCTKCNLAAVPAHGSDDNDLQQHDSKYLPTAFHHESSSAENVLSQIAGLNVQEEEIGATSPIPPPPPPLMGNEQTGVPASSSDQLGTALYDFEATDKSQISISSGDVLTLLQPETNGWCFVAKGSKQGFVPGSYVKKSSADANMLLSPAVAPTCKECKEKIVGPKVSIGEVAFHEFCFVCTECKDVIEPEENYELKNEKPHHSQCLATKTMPQSSCFVCAQAIAGNPLEVAGIFYHPKCLKCSLCQCQLSQDTLAEFEGKLCCKTCEGRKNEEVIFQSQKKERLQQKNFRPPPPPPTPPIAASPAITAGPNDIQKTLNEGKEECAKCGRFLQGSAVGALGGVYHEMCFTCEHCGRVISGVDGFAEKENHPYHENCYQEKFGKRCTQCNQVLTGRIVKALKGMYHPECFKCAECQKQLSGSFFELNDQPVCLTCKQKGDLPTNSPAPVASGSLSKDPSPNVNVTGEALYQFISQDRNQLSIEKGEQVMILRKDDDGWWLVYSKGKEGLVPGSYIKEAPSKSRRPPPPPPTQVHTSNSPTCPCCSSPNSLTARFCSNCGTVLLQ